MGIEYSEKRHKDDVECPHCDHEHDESWDFPESGVVSCHSCEKDFYMTRNIQITYSSSKVKA